MKVYAKYHGVRQNTSVHIVNSIFLGTTRNLTKFVAKVMKHGIVTKDKVIPAHNIIEFYMLKDKD